MESFYGGPKGQDFSVKQVFTSKYQLDRDLAKGWTSPISVGEFVAVSYGLPSDASYDTYKNEDLNNYKKSYNSTLWRKTYTDDGSGSAGGLSYELIASMTGNTPRIRINTTEVLDVDQNPNVNWDNTDLDILYLTFQLPQSQVIGGTTLQVLDCDETPSVSFVFTLDSGVEATEGRTYYKKTDGVEEYTIITFSKEEPYKADTYYYLENINNPVIRFAIPQAQVIEEAEVSFVNVGEEPTVSLDTTNINRPILKFQLPLSQSLQQGITTVLNANEMPSFSIDFEDINNPVINFSLPQSQVMGDPQTTVVGPEVNPSVIIDNADINAPVLHFSLPQSVKFYMGELLGEKTAGSYEETDPSFSDYNVGDYYINAPTGFIYKITQKSGTTCTFQYIACIQQPLPTVTVKELAPYTDGGDTTTPTVTREFTNDENTAWNLEFGLPKAPEFSVSFDFIGASEAGDVTKTVASTTTVNLDFQIPRGARIFSGEIVTDETTSTTVSDAKQGDIYLNTNTGNIYQLDSSNIWVKQTGSLKGPVGDALNIVTSFIINETESLTDSLQNGVDYIEENYVGEITAEDIFAVTWVEYETNQETSYWYFKAANGVWGRVQLTGGISNLIDNAHNDEADGEVANKTYSIHYINSLIGGEVANKDKTLTTYSASQIEELLSWGSFSDLIT